MSNALRLVEAEEMDEEKALEAAISPDRTLMRQRLHYAARPERDRG